MGCRCGERRAALGHGLRAAGRGDLAGVRAAAGHVGRTTIEDVEAMARAMARPAKFGPRSGVGRANRFTGSS